MIQDKTKKLLEIALQNEAAAADLAGQVEGISSAIGLTGQAGPAGSYVPANVANWSGSAPASIAEALDRLAAKATPVS